MFGVAGTQVLIDRESRTSKIGTRDFVPRSNQPPPGGIEADASAYPDQL